MDVQREIEVLRADLRQVRRDLRQLVRHAGVSGRERISDTGSRWWEGGKALEDRVEEHVMEALNEASERARATAHRAKEEVQEHPLIIGLAVAGLAVLAFTLLGRNGFYHRDDDIPY